jgi:hypothetical protein
LVINSRIYMFDHSTELGIISLFWSTLGNEIKLGVKCTPPANNWVGLGFNNKAQMTISRAFIASKSAAGVVALDQFRLLDKTENEVVNQTSIGNVKKDVEFKADGSVVFMAQFPTSEVPSFTNSDGKTGIIYAYGPFTPAGKLLQHTSHGSDFIDFASNARDGDVDNVSPNYPLIGLFHAIFMAIAWLIVVPIGSVLGMSYYRARMFPRDKQTSPPHTLAHRSTNHVAVLFALTAFVLGYVYGRHKGAHFILGTLVFVGMVLLVAVGIVLTRLDYKKSDYIPIDELHPTQDNAGTVKQFFQKHATLFSEVHAWGGRVLWILAIINVYTAFRYIGTGAKVAVIVLTILGALVVAFGAATSLGLLGSKPPVTDEREDHFIESHVPYQAVPAATQQEQDRQAYAKSYGAY